MRLWYRKPANEWPNALPIGNGRLGAMIFGQVGKERWQLNENSLWYGSSRDRNAPDSLKHLSAMRQLLDDGNISAAEDLAELAFLGQPECQRHYETLGAAALIFPHQEQQTTDYERWLDLDNALSGVKYMVEEVQYSRETFASYDYNVIAGEFTASSPGKVSLRIRINRQNGLPISYKPQNLEEKIAVADDGYYYDRISFSDDVLVMQGQAGGEGVKFALAAAVTHVGGSVEYTGETIVVRDANKAQLWLAAATTFREQDPTQTVIRQIQTAKSVGYQQVKAAHVSDYQLLFSRVKFNLGRDSIHERFPSPCTSELMTEARNGQPNTSLIPLYFQFGRYLLISCSRPGPKALPANLQGIWNEKMSPIWGSKWTININIQMNYWPAEVTNLFECHTPLFDHMERMVETGKITAQRMYGCRGWMSHHNTDLWADTAPQGRNMKASIWPMGAAWLCTHIWNHYEFTGDRDFLEKRYEMLRGCVEFFLDFLTPKNEFLVTSPSSSPENTYRLPNGEEGSVCAGPTMDNQILYKLFSDYLAAAVELRKSEDAEICAKVENAKLKLPPPRIGQYGQLLEWFDEYEEVEPGHRHISHLWGLFPGEQITPDQPDLIKASKVTLARRAASGGGHTGWSRAWMIALWARLLDGDTAAYHIREILRTSTYDSLLDDHPPFQIDGNFGATAGITEMLLQSHRGDLRILPALPTSWPDGNISGICARGGFEVDIEWRDGVLKHAKVRSKLGKDCSILYCHKIRVISEGQTLKTESSDSNKITFSTKKGCEYLIEQY